MHVLNVEDAVGENMEREYAYKATPMIALGEDFSVALKADGTVWTWGDNTYGQLGCSPNALRNSKYPVRVRILDNNGNSVTNIISVAAGSNHSLALTNTGEVYAWGRNDDGQLGRGTVTAYPVYPNSFDDLSVVNSYYDLIASAVIYGNGKGLPDYTPTRMNGFRDLQLSGVWTWRLPSAPPACCWWTARFGPLAPTSTASWARATCTPRA